MRIYHNISAMNAQRMFGINAHALDINTERLSSGMRVNRARDDAAGLAISERMRGQIRGLHMASRNAQDGISLIQTAEGWLQETTDVVQRIRELSVQAANGVYTDEDRHYIGIEIAQLVDEIDRISEQAQFSSGQQHLLDGAHFGMDEPDFFVPATGGTTGTGTTASTSGTGLPMDNVIDPNDPSAPAAGDMLVIHVGANTDQRLAVQIDNMNATALRLKGKDSLPAVDVSSVNSANASLQTLDVALSIINNQRANLGAFQNRLEHAIRGIDYAAENLQAAESLIRDTDMAAEMVEFVKNQILSQSTASMLAQANLKPQIILRVLG